MRWIVVTSLLATLMVPVAPNGCCLPSDTATNAREAMSHPWLGTTALRAVDRPDARSIPVWRAVVSSRFTDPPQRRASRRFAYPARARSTERDALPASVQDIRLQREPVLARPSAPPFQAHAPPA